MRFRSVFTVLTYTVSIGLMMPRTLGAWGNSGHEAVAWVAWQQMRPEVRARAIALIRQIPTLKQPAPGTKVIPGFAEFVKDLPAGLTEDQKNLYLFMRAATWPDSIKHQWLHDSDNPPKGVTVDVNVGFADQASHGYWHFVDTGFTQDGSTVPPTASPNAATQIVAFRQAIASGEADALKAYDLCWLEHMVGDIHQPLHGTSRFSGGKSDIGANSVMIRLPAGMAKVFEGSLSSNAPRDLHAFWDDLPGEGAAGPVGTAAEAFGKTVPKAVGAVENTDPNVWAAESLAMAKKDAYSGPIGKTTAPADGTAYLVTQAYYDTALADAKARIALAGARLAKLLNENLN